MQVQTERPLTTDSEIRRLHNDEGLNFTQIAGRCGIDLDSVRRVIGVRKSESTEDEIGRLYFQEGFTFGQIAKHLGVSKKTIRRAFEKNNWEFRKSTTTKQLDSSWIHHLYYIEGFSQMEIAGMRGVHQDTIQKLFWEQGWIHRGKQSAKETGDIDAERREYQRNRRQELKDTRVRMFGLECHACYSETKQEKSLHLHRKDGTEHDKHLFSSLKRLKSLSPDEWAALCDRCRLGIHLLMKVFGFDWNRIEVFLTGRNESSGTQRETLDLPDEDVPVSKAFESLGPDFHGTKDDLKKAVFGDACHLYAYKSDSKSLILHRKDGKIHPPSMTKSKKHLQKLNPSDWALVCPDCHNIAQWALDKLGIEWSELVNMLKMQ